MAAMDVRAAWRAWRSYRGAGASTRAFLLARMAVAPLGPMGPDLRALRGRVLSLGPGHGLLERYLAEINPHVTVEGVELDEGRVKIARASAERAPRVDVRVGDVTRLEPDAPYDAAMAVDVLHHLPCEYHREVAEALGRCLVPGGVLLVKEMATEPRRQYLWNRFHDRVVAGPEPICCRPPDDLAALLREAGFEAVSHRRLRRLRLYPQYLVRATAPARSAA
jgi:SAM-dependent methyltransferase